jgi:hypothetical protein
MHRGIATFTLDWGRCPPWLFARMTRLARAISIVMVENLGPEKFLQFLADPVWFQSFGSILAFDWNASGLTTTTLGALKYALSGLEKDLGIFIAGGKGKTSRKTPDQIIEKAQFTKLNFQQTNKLVFLSKLTAKVDSALIQDGFQIYHHSFIFTKSGQWAVIQQGMNIAYQKARRYHWYSPIIKDPTIEPHQGIQSEVTIPKVLNLTAKKSLANRENIIKITTDKKTLQYEVKRLIHRSGEKHQQLTLLNISDREFYSEKVVGETFTPRLEQSINQIIQKPINNLTDVLMTQKVGPKTIRALSLIAELVSGAKPSFEDPVRYTFAFGGKDGIPYPVDRKTYDQTIDLIEKAIKKSGLGYAEKEKALKRKEKIIMKGTYASLSPKNL